MINVEDDGPGVNEQNWHKVFSPFFQEQTHRNRDGESYGLGLAIAAKVADWHHEPSVYLRAKSSVALALHFQFRIKAPKNVSIVLILSYCYAQ